ncbi:hypothetical protein [Pseudomonas sp. LjRoot263]
MRRINQRAMGSVIIWFLGITISRRRPKADGGDRQKSAEFGLS